VSSNKEEDQNAEEASQAEEIVANLRQVYVLSSQGQSVAEATGAIVTEVTYYRWRQEYGGLIRSSG
jgi:hypothetical protein